MDCCKIRVLAAYLTPKRSLELSSHNYFSKIYRKYLSNAMPNLIVGDLNKAMSLTTLFVNSRSLNTGNVHTCASARDRTTFSSTTDVA